MGRSPMSPGPETSAPTHPPGTPGRISHTDLSQNAGGGRPGHSTAELGLIDYPSAHTHTGNLEPVIAAKLDLLRYTGRPCRTAQRLTAGFMSRGSINAGS